jgi:GT2 family glycosyltransferase
MRIAVLLATFNRKEKTLACLRSLFGQQLSADVELDVFLTDDASSDGTTDAVKQEFPLVKIFLGSGSLFWAGGMRNSWYKALETTPDYFLLLNDDTVLEPLAISKLLQYRELNSAGPAAICIGSTMDHSNGQISYGGRKLYHQKKVQSYSVYSDTDFLECDLANANIMMVPMQIVKRIGILSEDYTHSIADFDYTLKAKKAGYKAVVVPGILGHCTDDHGNNWKSSNVSLRERISYLKSPKGLAYKEYLHFIKKHFPSHLPAAFIKLWLKTLFPVVWDKFKKS